MKYVKYRISNITGVSEVDLENSYAIDYFDTKDEEDRFYAMIKRFEDKGVNHIIEFIDEDEYDKIAEDNFYSWELNQVRHAEAYKKYLQTKMQVFHFYRLVNLRLNKT